MKVLVLFLLRSIHTINLHADGANVLTVYPWYRGLVQVCGLRFVLPHPSTKRWFKKRKLVGYYCLLSFLLILIQASKCSFICLFPYHNRSQPPPSALFPVLLLKSLTFCLVCFFSSCDWPGDGSVPPDWSKKACHGVPPTYNRERGDWHDGEAGEGYFRSCFV